MTTVNNETARPGADSGPSAMTGGVDRSFDAALQEVLVWARRQFPHATTASRAAHFRREAAELVENPASAEEMADCLMLIAELADSQGIDLAAAVRAKLAINVARVWGEPDAEGVVEHVREVTLLSSNPQHSEEHR